MKQDQDPLQNSLRPGRPDCTQPCRKAPEAPPSRLGATCHPPEPRSVRGPVSPRLRGQDSQPACPREQNHPHLPCLSYEMRVTLRPGGDQAPALAEPSLACFAGRSKTGGQDSALPPPPHPGAPPRLQATPPSAHRPLHTEHTGKQLFSREAKKRKRENNA